MDRYLPVLVAILLQTTTYGDHINLKKHGLQTVPTNISAFTESLDLSWNLMRTITNDSFINLSSLISLDLSHNILDSLQPWAFRGLTKLLFLNLNHNNLQLTYEVYPPNVFRPLHRLETLKIIYNANTDTKDLPNGYPDQLFRGLGSVTFLAIDGINGLPFGLGVLHMSRLKSLQVNLLPIVGAVPEETLAIFANLSIESLLLECSKLEPGNLKHFSNLRSLHLITIGLSRALSALVDVRHRNFTFLSLSNCNSGLRGRLDTSNLILNRNNTAHLATLCVKHLDLSYNYIISFDFRALFQFKYPDCLESLNGGENYLPIATQIWTFAGLMRFRNLRHLNVSPGKTFYNPDSNPLYPVASQLRLGFPDAANYTLYLPPSLKSVNISFVGGDISRDTFIFFNAENLRNIDGAYTRFVGCSVAALGLQKVEMINISGMDCSKINPKFFASFPGLQILIAQNCRLRQGLANNPDGRVFSPFKYLKTLDLSSNDFRTFHKDLFKPLLNLEVLILRNNKLTVLPAALFTIGSLRYLDLSFNVLSSFSSEEMQWLSSVSFAGRSESVSVSLGDNSFICTCNTLNFVHWILDNSHRIVENSSLLCSMKNGTVADVFSLAPQIKDMDVSCISKFWLTFSVVGSCLLTLSIISAIFGYRYRWNIKYWIRTKCRRGPVYDELPMEHYQYDAFVAYNSENYRWACTVLRNVLETQNNYTLCLHDRDFPVGASIQQNIVDAVNNSRKVILVITRAFLRSDWCEFEIQMAGMRMVRDGRENAIVVIMMEEIPVAEMPRSLLNLWKHITFLLWENEQTDEVIFWERLLEVMARP